MTEAGLKAIIQAAGGRCWALDYAGALLEKVTSLEAAGGQARLVLEAFHQIVPQAKSC